MMSLFNQTSSSDSENKSFTGRISSEHQDKNERTLNKSRRRTKKKKKKRMKMMMEMKDDEKHEEIQVSSTAVRGLRLWRTSEPQNL